jgi:hypothetical protein
MLSPSLSSEVHGLRKGNRQDAKIRHERQGFGCCFLRKSWRSWRILASWRLISLVDPKA